jgi:TPR repeat protein
MIRFLFVVIGVVMLAWGVVWIFVGDRADPAAGRQFEADAAPVAELGPKAAAGDVRAQYELAVHLRDGRGVAPDARRAARLFLAAGAKGLADAHYALGRMHETGKGVGQSYAKAAKLYRLVGRLGAKADAYYALGDLYFHGRGVIHDYADAFTWYRQAAERGHAAAQYVVGAMYAEGWGRDRDTVTAYMWYSLALGDVASVRATNPVFDPEKARATIAGKMNRAQIERAEAMVRDWRPKGR